MTRAFRIHEYGGPEALRWEEVDLGAPGEGEVVLQHTAIGLNYIDIAYRTGKNRARQLPFTPGLEAAGTVAAVGPGVTDLREGDRVAYGTGPMGSYAEARVISASRLLKLPGEIGDETAAAVLLKGLTAQCLLRRCYPVAAGDTILVHAAAGGVGNLLCQWASSLGATVIGTVGTRGKADYAQRLGCHHPIVYTEEDFVEQVREITGGRGVHVVYDSVGRATFEKSLACLRPGGMLAHYGQTSGPVEALDLSLLVPKALAVSRPGVFVYLRRREDLLQSVSELFSVLSRGDVKVDIGQRYALADAPSAHRALETRQTRGSSILLP